MLAQSGSTKKPTILVNRRSIEEFAIVYYKLMPVKNGYLITRIWTICFQMMMHIMLWKEDILLFTLLL